MIESGDVLRTGHEAYTDVPILEQDIRLDKKSLLSPPSSKSESGKYAHVESVMRSVLGDLAHNPRRREKYKRWINASFHADRLWRLAGLPHAENRFRAFVLVYAQQRLYDDIIDGDTPVRIAPDDRVAYAEKRVENLSNGAFDPADSVDAFAIKILSDIKAIDPHYEETARKRLGQIMKSIAFDGKRIAEKGKTGSWAFSSREELDQHFSDLDIEGVIGLTLFLFGFEDSEKNRALLTPLGRAARISYNLRDFADDIRAGICNIPKEDADALGISDADLQAVVAAGGDMRKYPKNVQAWLRAEARRGKELLRKHRDQPLSGLALSKRQERHGIRIPAALYRGAVRHGVLNAMYVLEARKTFWKTTAALGK